MPLPRNTWKTRVYGVTLAFALWPSNSVAQDCGDLASHLLSVEQVYSPQNVCNWVTQGLTKNDQIACSYEGTWAYQDSIWAIKVLPITTSEQGFIEYSIDVSGPGNLLSDTYRVGYERIVSQLILFYSARCVEEPYLYLRLAHGNRKNRDELFAAGGNTEVFDPGEGWTGNYMESVYAALRIGAESEIGRIWGEARND